MGIDRTMSTSAAKLKECSYDNYAMVLFIGVVEVLWPKKF